MSRANQDQAQPRRILPFDHLPKYRTKSRRVALGALAGVKVWLYSWVCVSEERYASTSMLAWSTFLSDP